MYRSIEEVVPFSQTGLAHLIGAKIGAKKGTKMRLFLCYFNVAYPKDISYILCDFGYASTFICSFGCHLRTCFHTFIN